MLIFLFVSLLAAPVASTASAAVADSESAMVHPRPIRLKKPLTLGTEFGVNGLTGFGPALSYTFDAHWSLDVAAGVSAQLARAGARARYTFLPGQLSPFAGLGVMYALGTPYDLKGFGDDDAVVYSIAAAPLAQGVFGVAYHHRNGFTVLGALGWAQLLTRGSNVIVKEGALSPTQLRGVRYAVGSGPVLSVNLGYSF